MAPYDFFSATGLMESSRILLRDSSHRMYMDGVGPDAPTFKAVIVRLRDEIEKLAPERVTCVGTSSGGFAAMLFGHILEADRVHAFAPSLYASVILTIVNRDWTQLRTRILPQHLLFDLVLPLSTWKYRDLTRVLKSWNGRTRYTVHVCAHNEDDVRRASQLRGYPGVEISAHECSTHQVARHLVREGRLLSIFQEE